MPTMYLHFIRILFIAALILFSDTFSLAQINIGVVIDGPWERNEEVRMLFEQEISDLTSGEFDVRFAAEKRIVADWSISGVDNALDQLFADPEVDVVMAMGLIASDNVCRRADLPKPVIAPFVVDAEVQGLPLKDGASGVKNLNYVSLPSTFSRDLKAFQEIVPFKNITILLSARAIEGVPDLFANIQKQADTFEAKVNLIAVENAAAEVFTAIPSDAEAVYVAPLLHLAIDEFDKIIQGLIERKLPSFSLMGRKEVERGIMATVNPDIFPRVARRVALNLQQILLGKDAGTIPVAFAAGEKLVINMATVRAIGISIPFAVLTEAETLNPIRTEIDRVLNLESALKQAIAMNLDLATKNREVTAGAQNITRARSNLLPQLDLGATAFQVDKDRAGASFGALPERKFSGSLTFTQLLFSNEAWTNYGAQKNLQLALEKEREQLRLDIAQEAATAYLQVLRANTNERIERENLQRTRTNLELARVREAVGYSGRADVYRWESEIATNRSRVITANSQRNLAEIQLNRLLHEPSEAAFLTQEIDIQDAQILEDQGPILKYFESQVAFRALRHFMVQEGLKMSPELRQLDALITAQEKILAGAKRAFWTPTVALQAEFENTFSKTTTGQGGGDAPIIPGLELADDLNWTVAFNLSFPLFTSGAKLADKIQTQEELAQLRLQRDAIAERIEQRIRSALHTAGASFAAIKLSQDAATAARQNLDLVVDAYSRGVLSIIDLIDAQNASLVAEQASANAVYTFIIDFVEVQRAVGIFRYFMTETERAEMLQRLEAFAEGIH